MTRMNPSCRAATFAKAAATPSGWSLFARRGAEPNSRLFLVVLCKCFGAVEFGTVQRTSERDVRGTDDPSERRRLQELDEGFPVPQAAPGSAASLRQQPHELLPRRAAAPPRPAEEAV